MTTRWQGQVPRCPRYASLDLWRGVACLLVLLHHGTFTEPSTSAYASLGAAGKVWSQVAMRLWLGVPIFFVISGYCIAATADAQRRRHGRPAADYFYRRFRRIFPPYWAVLLCTVGLFTLIDVALWPASLSGVGEFLRPWWYSPSQWFGNLTLTEMWRWHAFGTSKAMILGHAWTLCYEEQFYIVVGALLLITRRWLFAGLAAVTLAVGGLWIAGADVHPATQGFFWDGAWLLFAAGTAVYYIPNYLGPTWRAAGVCLFTVLALWFARYPAVLLALRKNDSQELFVAMVFAGLLLLLRGQDERLARSSAMQPLMRCGLMCYSLYLIHLPVAVLLRGSLKAAAAPDWLFHPLATLPVVTAASLWLSWQFHLRVERRFMSSPSVRVAPAPAGAAIVEA